MKRNALIITGIEARKDGLYTDGAFVMERPEESYDSGIWIVEPNNYAKYYSNFDEMYEAINS